MNKSSLFGFILIAIILFGWMWTMQPSKEELAEQKRIQDSIMMARREAAILDSIRLAEEQRVADSIAQLIVPTPDNEVDSVAYAAALLKQQQDKFGAFASAAEGEEQCWTVENQLQRITFSNKGGYIKQVVLKEFYDYPPKDSVKVVSFDPETAVFDLSFFSNNRIINTSQLYFQPFVNGEPYQGGDLTVPAGGQLAVAMRLYANSLGESSNGDHYLEFVYTINDDNYMFDFDLRTVGMKDIIANNINYMNLDWRVDLLQHEKNIDRFINSTVYYKPMNDNEVDKLNDRKSKEETINSSVNWVSFKERFFCNVLVAKNGFASAKIGNNTEEGAKNSKYFKTMSTSLEVPYDFNAEVNEFPMSFYFGPNHFKTLKSYGLNLQRQIDVGNFFLIRWINYGVIYVFNWLGSYGWNYGIVILILTILIKILLFPIAFKSYKSTAITRVLKPEMDAIAAKYPKEEDAMKKQQAVMNLQKQAGASPTSGCIPMLLQFPILIAVFRFFPSSIELRQQPFLWAEDLSTYDSIWDLPFNIPFYGDHVSLFCLLMTITTFIYTYVNNKQMDTGANPQMKGMKVMMYLMPIMFLGIFNSYSAGLSYYYMLANIITFLQMFVFRKMINEDKVRATIEENKRKPQKKSRFMQRLEEAQKAQQQQMRNAKR
ncbi:MAG: membrane protein insertase YidC [Bacteroidales bacterium]|nr:membrane protein insertase YidC [Bacteroidales bacterium]